MGKAARKEIWMDAKAWVKQWQETGRRLGALNASGIAPQKSGTRSTTINFAPQITIQGNADKSTMESAMKDAVSDLRRMLKDIQRDERRLSYG